MKRRWKLCSWNISTVSMISSITGTTAKTERLRLRALLGVPPSIDLVALRQAGVQLVDRRRECRRPRSPAGCRGDVRAHGERRHPVAAPDQRILLLVLEGRELAERARCARRAAGPAGCAASRARCAPPRSARATTSIEVDVVAHLGHRRAGDRGVRAPRRASASSGRGGAPRPGRPGCAPGARARSSRS